MAQPVAQAVGRHAPALSRRLDGDQIVLGEVAGAVILRQQRRNLGPQFGQLGHDRGLKPVNPIQTSPN